MGGEKQTDPVEVIRAVRKSELVFPLGYKSTSGRNLIGEFLCKNPQRRLGTSGGCGAIAAHDFFRCNDAGDELFSRLLQRIAQPPYIPRAEQFTQDADAIEFASAL